VAAPEEPPGTPAQPGQPRGKRPPTWILLTVLASVLILAGAILGGAALVSKSTGDPRSDAQSASPPPVKINNSNTVNNGQRQAQRGGGQSQAGQSQAGQSQAGQSQAGQSQAGQSQAGQSQARGQQGPGGVPRRYGGRRWVVIVPLGRPWRRGPRLLQYVRIEINYRVIVRVRVFYRGGWYVLTGPCRYSRAARGCTGPYLGTIRPPGYSGGEPKAPMTYRYRHGYRPPPGPRQPQTPSQPQPPRPPSSQPPPRPSQPPTSHQPSQPQSPPSQQQPSQQPLQQQSPPSQQQEQPSQQQPSQQPPSRPATTGFLVPSALAQSVASEQTSELADAPAGTYRSAGGGTVTVTCTSIGTTRFSCTASDSDGDTGAADIVTVAADGSSWSDSGMTWTGPDFSGSYTTAAVTDYSGS
jgi:hypothetical protein